jgi:hypothetical protein
MNLGVLFILLCKGVPIAFSVGLQTESHHFPRTERLF